MLTYKDLWQSTLRYFDLSDETDGKDVDLAKKAVQSANQSRSIEDNWKFMLSTPLTLTVIAGVQDYILPVENFRKFNYLWSSTNQRFVSQVPFREIPFNGVSANRQSDSDTRLYTLRESGAVVKAQPSTAATLTVTSSTAEPNAPTVYIEGEDASGLPLTATLMKDGVSSEVFAKITYVAKVADWAGTLTITATGYNALLSLGATEYGKQYPILSWVNVPNSAETFIYQYFKKPRTLTRDFDIPDIPYPESNLLMYDALLQLATYNELDSESVNIWREERDNWKQNLYLHKMEDGVFDHQPFIVNTQDFK